MHSTNQTKIADLPIAANKILANSHTDLKPLSFKTHTPTDKGRRKRTKQFCKEKIVRRVFVLRRIISQTLLGNSTSQENLSCIFKKNRKKNKKLCLYSLVYSFFGIKLSFIKLRLFHCRVVRQTISVPTLSCLLQSSILKLLLFWLSDL